MSSNGDGSPPRSVWPRVLGWSCLTLLILGGTSFCGTFCYLYVSHGFEARKINDQNFSAVTPLLAALEAYRKANGHYPTSLCDLRLEQKPRLVERTRLLYTSSGNGTEYWLAIFPWREASIIMPSDAAIEYSPRGRKWREMDIADTQAKSDEAWSNGCRAGTMTGTR